MPNFCSPFSWIRFRPDLVQTAIYTNLLALILLLGYVQIEKQLLTLQDKNWDSRVRIYIKAIVP